MEIFSNASLSSVISCVFSFSGRQYCASVKGVFLSVSVVWFWQIEGWPEFDKRRKSKYNKQLDFNVIMSSSGFDEGADAQKWSHW